MAFNHVPNTTLYNKRLPPAHNTTEVPDSPGGLLSGQTLIGDGSTGWDWAPLPEDPGPAEQARPVEYAPVERDKPKTARSTKEN